MLLTFLVVQLNSNLLLGQASVHSVQLSMNWAKCLPPLSSLLYSLIPTFRQDRPAYTVYSGQRLEPSAYHISVAHPLWWWQLPWNSFWVLFLSEGNFLLKDAPTIEGPCGHITHHHSSIDHNWFQTGWFWQCSVMLNCLLSCSALALVCNFGCNKDTNYQKIN